MSAETTSMPPSSVREPKVKRTSAEISATPMVASSRPKQPPMRPFNRLPSDSAAISERPKSASQKYSTGPKASATSASGGASSSSAKAPTSPPTTAARQAAVVAREPAPHLALGPLAQVVALAEWVTGGLNSDGAEAQHETRTG